MSEHAITVKSIRSLQGYGNLRALADVKYGPLTLLGCRVIRQPGQRAFVLLPQSRDKDGRFWPVLRADANLKDAIQTAILRSWEGEQGK